MLADAAGEVPLCVPLHEYRAALVIEQDEYALVRHCEHQFLEELVVADERAGIPVDQSGFDQLALIHALPVGIAALGQGAFCDPGERAGVLAVAGPVLVVRTAIESRLRELGLDEKARALPDEREVKAGRDAMPFIEDLAVIMFEVRLQVAPRPPAAYSFKGRLERREILPGHQGAQEVEFHRLAAQPVVHGVTKAPLQRRIPYLPRLSRASYHLDHLGEDDVVMPEGRLADTVIHPLQDRVSMICEPLCGCRLQIRLKRLELFRCNFLLQPVVGIFFSFHINIYPREAKN